MKKFCRILNIWFLEILSLQTDKDFFKGEFTKGYVTNFEYDPNRSAYLAKICFYKQLKKYYYYILAPQNLKVLDIVESVPLKIENHLVNEQDNFVRTLSL